MSDDVTLRIPVRLETDSFDRDKARLLSDLARLESESVTIPIEANLEGFRSAQSAISDIESERPTVPISVNDTEVQNTLTSLRNLEAVELAMTIGGPVAQLLMGGLSAGANFAFEFSGLEGILDMQGLLRDVEATTGRVIPNLDRLINDIFVSGWGETRAQIAGAASLATQLGVDNEHLAEAITSAFEATTAGAGDVNEILRAQQALVRTGLVSSYTEAADLIVTAVQNGAGSAGDVLDTIIEYSPDFASFDLTGQQIASTLAGGIANGWMNTDVIGDSLRELYTRLTDDLAGSEEMQNALSSINFLDEAQLFLAGELGGQEFLSGLVQAIQTIPNEAQADYVAGLLFGSTVQDLGSQGIVALDPFVNYLQTDYVNAAHNAGIAASANLSSAWERAQRIVSTGIGTMLEERFNITGLVDDLAGDIQAFFDSLQSGGDFTTSFRVAFDDNQIVDVLVTIREVLSDIFFALGSGLSGVLGTLGVDTSALDTGIQSLALMELEIDMATIRNPEDATNAVRDALARGIDVDTIVDSLNETWATALETNDIELLQASAEGMMQALSATSFTPEEIEALGGPEIAGQLIADMQGDVQNALANATETIHENLQVALNEALAQGDLVGALNIDEQLAMTGNTLLSGGTMQSAQFDALLAESGMTFDELTQLANDGMQAVSDYATESIDTSLETTEANWETATGGMATDMVTFRDSAIADYQAIEEQAFISTEAMRGQWALVGADIGGINLALGDMANNLLTMPSMSLTGIGSPTYNQTVNNNQSVTMNNANAAAAQASANSTAEIVGGNAPS